MKLRKWKNIPEFEKDYVKAKIAFSVAAALAVVTIFLGFMK